MGARIGAVKNAVLRRILPRFAISISTTAKDVTIQYKNTYDYTTVFRNLYIGQLSNP